MDKPFGHVPVLYNEVLDALDIKPGGIYVDGTVGGAGHSAGICERLSGKGLLIGVDRDGEAIDEASARLKRFEDSIDVRLLRDNYSEIPSLLGQMDIDSIDGCLLDIGVSSHQLDDASRGFSFAAETRLDMRMDRRQDFSAVEIVNGYGEDRLTQIMKDFGDERYAKSIARAIVAARKAKPIMDTEQLVDIINSAIPAKYRYEKGHPALRRVFQSIRIEVNEELDALSSVLDTLIDMLNDRGRLCVITFHSKEDLIVKSCFNKNESPCICPPDFPYCVCGRHSKGRRLTRKPILPSMAELDNNPRSASAKLRVFEKNRSQGLGNRDQ